MRVKKAGGQVYGAELTANERKALDMEARRALAEHTRKHELEIEALVVRQVRKKTGWGGVRLRRFFDDFDTDLGKLCDHYEMDDIDTPWLCIQELKKEGFDIEQWHRERHPNEKYDIILK